MGTPPKHDYPALIEEYEQRLASGETPKDILDDFATRGVHPGTFQNRRTQAKKAADTEAPRANGKTGRKTRKGTATTTTADPGRKPLVKRLQWREITIDPSIQQRISIDPTLVKDYIEAIQLSETFPPVVVFSPDGASPPYLLSEGFHRHEADAQLDILETDAEIRQGGYLEALDFACTVNTRHGLRPSTEDRAKAVHTQLTHWAGRSDREIARWCGVSPSTVGIYRKKMYPPEPVHAEPQDDSSISVQSDSNHDTQPTQSPETREPIPVDTSTVTHEPHEPTPVSAPHDPIRRALMQAQRHISAAMEILPEAERLSVTKHFASWIGDAATRMNTEPERQQLTQASQEILGIILAVAPDTEPAEKERSDDQPPIVNMDQALSGPR
jgi:hypothetical protein